MIEDEELTDKLTILGGEFDDAELDRRVARFQGVLRRLRADPAEAARIDALVTDAEHSQVEIPVTADSPYSRDVPGITVSERTDAAHGREGEAFSVTGIGEGYWELGGFEPIDPYEVALGPAAIRALETLPGLSDQKELVGALRTELMNGPNAHNEYRFDSAGAYDDPGGTVRVVYTATPLSFAGYIAVHRRMTREELRRLRRERRRRTAVRGFYVIDILAVESAFGRGSRSV